MTDKKFKDLKKLLFKKCTEIVNEKINHINTALKEAQDAANNETKSSAGDKHETSRAMAQLETEKLTNQLTEALKLLTVLAKVNLSTNNKTIALGSLVVTNKNNFYISISLGKLTIDNETIFAISTLSPIGKLLLTKKEGTTFNFNSKNYTISKIY